MINKKLLAVALILLVGGEILSSSCTNQRKVVSTAPSAVKDSVKVSANLSEESRKEFEYLFIEGIKQRTFEKYDEAIKIFSKCLELDPNSSAALYEMANIHVMKGDFQSSMLMLEKAVAINPENQYYHLLLVKVYQQNKMYEKAASEYEVLSKLNPDNPEYKAYQAAVLTMANKLDDALSIYTDLETKYGVNESTAVGKQQIYSQKGDRESAYREIEKLVQMHPTESKYYGMLADLYLADKNREKALEYYNKILELEPNDGFVHLSLANYYLDGNETNKAYDHIKIAFKNPDLDLETKAQMYMLMTQPGVSKIDSAQQLQLLHILIESHMDDERPRALLVDYYLAHKKIEEARKELRLVLDMKKDNYLYWERLLLINNDLADWKSMIVDADKAMKYVPDQPLLYILKSVGLLQMKRYSEIMTTIDTGIVKAKNDPKILSQLYMYKAEAFYNQKRFIEAFDLFDQVVKLDPENFMAMNNYAYYLSTKGVRLDVAENLSAKVIQANPENATYLDTYAWIFFKKKEYQLAKFYMENALSKAKSDEAVLIEHYGDILFFLGEKENALEQWKKSLKSGNESKILKQKISEKKYVETPEQ